MSTDPRNLKIRIRMSGPASPPVVEIPVTTAPSLRTPVSFTMAAVVLLIGGWGLWALLAQHNDDADESTTVDMQPFITTPSNERSSVAATALPVPETTQGAPSPAIQKATAAPQSRTPVKSPDTASAGANLIVHAVLSDKMRNHRPVTELAGNVPASDVTMRLHFFTEVHDVGSRRFTHRWEYRGKPVAQINFKPSGRNWSAASSKQIPTHMQGEWRVVLADDQGRALTSLDFVYGAN